MRRWLVGGLAVLALSCGGGDEEACKQANEVAEEIRQQAALDQLTGAPCVEGSTAGLSETRIAEYKAACARYEELKEKCDG